MYLFDEQPILANKVLARELGLNEALVLQQINYWIEINKKSGTNYYDGKYWTYNSIKSWQENDFDYMSIDTVKRTFLRLEKAGYLLVGNYNKDPRDKTKWYTINDNKLEELYLKLEQNKQEKERKILEQVSKNAMPNALGQNAPMQKCKMHQCISADCTNAKVQNAPMQEGKMHQPLPEITTEITTDIATHPSSHPNIKKSDELIKEQRQREGREDGNIKIKSYQSCLEELRKNTGYNQHIEVGNESIAREFDKIIKILADVMILNPEDTLIINQKKLPVYVVQERFKELDSSHMEYLLESLSNNESKIRNVRSFILTAAYNAPINMDAYYTARVSYDMRNQGSV